MASERPRLVVDTNVWISFLIGKTLTGLGELLVDNRIVLLQCEELFSEMLEVLERPKFRQYFSPDDIRELVEVGEPRPIGERGGWNVYGFVADSPAGNVDPYGKLRYGVLTPQSTVSHTPSS
jgi:hypothetical protein